jgi:hypothetical protein
MLESLLVLFYCLLLFLALRICHTGKKTSQI